MISNSVSHRGVSSERHAFSQFARSLSLSLSLSQRSHKMGNSTPKSLVLRESARMQSKEVSVSLQIVFFGEALPRRFFESFETDLARADLLIAASNDRIDLEFYVWCLRVVETECTWQVTMECSGEPRDLCESLELSTVRIGLETTELQRTKCKSLLWMGAGSSWPGPRSLSTPSPPSSTSCATRKRATPETRTRLHKSVRRKQPREMRRTPRLLINRERVGENQRNCFYPDFYGFDFATNATLPRDIFHQCTHIKRLSSWSLLLIKNEAFFASMKRTRPAFKRVPEPSVLSLSPPGGAPARDCAAPHCPHRRHRRQ